MPEAKGYAAFVLADPSFFDVMHSERTAGESFPIAGRPLPAGWSCSEQEDWFVLDPGVAGVGDLPMQGWKIHVSATVDNAERVLEAVWDYCVPQGIQFKFLRSKIALTARVSKYADRGYSGKLVAIYPIDDSACQKILRELGEILDGEPSPYILSDLRWGKGPLYVRYGGFAMRYTVDERGNVVAAVSDPDGNLVLDRRDPMFYVPPWVQLPDFLAPHLAARNAVTITDLPYTFEHVVHFSNGGGIYFGRDKRTGEEVVIKEGRPHAGVDAWGHDAVRRLEREYDILQQLADIPGIPKVYDLFWLGEHRFMVMEYVDGDVLSAAVVRRFPLVDGSAGPDDYARYAEWAMDIHRKIVTTLTAVNERGFVYGDLHLFNVVVRPDNTISLLDFEVTTRVAEATGPLGLGNPGFSAPRSATGFAIDRYALACMGLALFLPMTSLVGLHRPKARHYAEIIAEHFPVPADYLTSAVEAIVPPDTPHTPSPRIEPDVDQWPGLRDGLVRAIVASATPERDDRLFPGDPEQFSVGGLGLAHGAAGVLYALSVTGGGRYPQFEEWLMSRARNPVRGTRVGLCDGLHGVAFVVDHLGYRQEALDILDICTREKWEILGPDLATGLAGIGLNLLHFADLTGEPALRLAAHRAAELVAENVGHAQPDDDGTLKISGGGQPYAGLMRGRAGQGLLLLRTYDDTGDTAFLDRAAVALRQDLQRCVVRPNGSMEVNEGWRSMPYFDVGSVGIGLVLDEYLTRRDDEQFAEAIGRIEPAAGLTMYVLPGLFTGRAGILLWLAGRSPAPITDPRVAKQVRGLAWHALPFADGMAFPGTELMRLSMDLATGTAGILLALGAVLHDQPVHLPLLTPTRRPITAPTPQTPAPTGAGFAVHQH
ncbi:MAG TPA: class III lanthionine synthetase LanKC [Pseudonocardiaceae bacterium]|jgi:hypothetical protein